MYDSSEPFFLRRHGVITGPFTTEQILVLLKSDAAASDAMLSHDKISWQSAAGLFAPPDPAPIPLPPAEPPPTPEPAPVPLRPGSAAAPETEMAIPVCAAGENTFFRIAGDAVSMLWNSSDFLLRIRRRGSNATLLAGVIAALTALGLIALSVALFGSRYGVPPARLWLLAPGFILGAGVLLWLMLVAIRIIGGAKYHDAFPELDFLTATLGMLNLAGANAAVLALAFFHGSAPDPASSRIALLADSAILAGGLFFFANLLTGIRLDLIANAHIPPRHATWLGALCLWGLLIANYGLFYFIHRT